MARTRAGCEPWPLLSPFGGRAGRPPDGEGYNEPPPSNASASSKESLDRSKEINAIMMSPAAVLLLLVQATPQPSPSPAAEPTPKPAPAGPVVVLDTSMGKIKIGLHKDKAPLTVDNFIKYVRSGHYDGTIFHRVMPGFMIQGGGMDPSLEERPTRPPVRSEARNGLRNSRGTVAMARTNDPNSATAQFFINVKDNHSLDFGIRGAGYTVFGEVLEGMDVVDKIVAVPTTSKGPHDDVPITPVLIKTAREVGGGGGSAASRPRPRPQPKPTPRAESRPPDLTLASF
jgi:peptidyl-prolyl cis-trans isomerase A (cyclophilin A)